MNRLPALLLVLGMTLVACVKAGGPATASDTSGTPVTGQAAPAPAPVPTPGEPGTAPSATAPADSEPGRGAKPSGCQEDKDCEGGKVCETCGPEGKCCVLGCHQDEQCAAGQKCHRVQCIRAPCPGQCQ